MKGVKLAVERAPARVSSGLKAGKRAHSPEEVQTFRLARKQWEREGSQLMPDSGNHEGAISLDFILSAMKRQDQQGNQVISFPFQKIGLVWRAERVEAECS